MDVVRNFRRKLIPELVIFVIDYLDLERSLLFPGYERSLTMLLQDKQISDENMDKLVARWKRQLNVLSFRGYHPEWNPAPLLYWSKPLEFSTPHEWSQYIATQPNRFTSSLHTISHLGNLSWMVSLGFCIMIHVVRWTTKIPLPKWNRGILIVLLIIDLLLMMLILFYVGFDSSVKYGGPEWITRIEKRIEKDVQKHRRVELMLATRNP